MPGIQSFTDLQNQVSAFLFARTDLVSQIPYLIQLFEAKANRLLRCRQMETLQFATIDITQTNPEFLALPADYQSMRRIRIGNGIAGTKPTLKFAVPQQIDDWRDENDDPAQPLFYTVFGNYLEFYPTPDSDYVVDMIYRQYIPALTSTNTVNWLLQTAPDAYLNGTLEQTEKFLMNDERLPLWKQETADAIAGLNQLSIEATYNSGPLVIRRNRRGY